MLVFIPLVLAPLLSLIAHASPAPAPASPVFVRDDGNSTDSPQFPSSPASCGVCQEVPVMVNFTTVRRIHTHSPIRTHFLEVITNPGSFVDVITCACQDPFHSNFGALELIPPETMHLTRLAQRPASTGPFQQTNQESFLMTDDPDAVINGINKVCGLEGSLFGIGVSSSIIAPDATRGSSSSPTDTGTTGTSTDTTSAPSTSQSSNALRVHSTSGVILGAVALLLAAEW
ncbi:hypothetical protein C8F01DRAFT_1162676 [Mycena amicta]|nr:hypothetical protein C8F01DRAFT_1162676 [Mycena amicta]